MPKFLVEKGADVNAKDNEGRTALAWAASCCSLRITAFLIENGADVNAIDNKGSTILLVKQ